MWLIVDTQSVIMWGTFAIFPKIAGSTDVESSVLANFEYG